MFQLKRDAISAKAMVQKGFSLIELLVVVAIIGVLAGAGVYAYAKYLENVKKDTLVNFLDSVAKSANTDTTAIANDLQGRSNLLDGLSATEPTCQDLAVQMVSNLNKTTKNPFDANVPAAVYGNAVVSALPVKRRGMILVSCTAPAAKAKELADYRLYQCACTESDCSWDAVADFTNPDICPQPPVPTSVPANGPCYGFAASSGSCS